MLELTLNGQEMFNHDLDRFINLPDMCIQLEHSLFSLSKWESKWETPFLSQSEKTQEQTLDYVRCMVVGPEPPENFELLLTNDDISKVVEYINAKMTATTFNDRDRRPNREVITSELIFHWMISLGIPFECQHWHLSRLLTLIQVCSLKNNPKKMSKKDAINQQRELNAQRRKQFNTKG